MFFEDRPLCLETAPGTRLELDAPAFVFQGGVEVNGTLVLDHTGEGEGLVFFGELLESGGKPLLDRSGCSFRGRSYFLPPGGVELPAEAVKLEPAMHFFWH